MISDCEHCSRCCNLTQAHQKIKEIFKNVNSLPEEELTEEAFDVFLDTIKRLSEYVDSDEVREKKYNLRNLSL